MKKGWGRHFLLAMGAIIAFGCNGDQDRPKKEGPLEESGGDPGAEQRDPPVDPAAEEPNDLVELPEGFQLSSGQSWSVKASWKDTLQCCNDGVEFVTLTFMGQNHRTPSDVDALEFHLYMPAMGHGTDEETQVTGKKDGQVDQWIVQGIYFNMPGDPEDETYGGWEAHLTAKVDGVKDTVVLPVPKVSRPPRD